ncbi:MAG: GGDEF domain-containing protein, partial [Devosia sp.]|nr:GGDEF domain-containing protein [Devosia sp.]
MSAAGFVLAINLFIAGIFATAFAVVAAHYRLAIGARWLCAAYAIGILNGVLEFILPHQADARPTSLAIFAAFLASMTLCNIGLARHYRVRVPWRLLAGVVFVSLAVNVLILEMPRGSLLRGLLYQAPYAIMNIVGARIILSRPANRALDLALLALFLLSALNFIAKPILAMLIGS